MKLKSYAHKHHIIAWTDGACQKNPGGPGGWGVRFEHPDSTIVRIYGGDPSTTNNKMEMMAVIQAFEYLDGKLPVIVYTDSQYVQKGLSLWVQGWIKRGWVTSGKGKSPVKNRDLWERMLEASNGFDYQIKWVKGHSGNPGNEDADNLASTGMRLAIARKEIVRMKVNDSQRARCDTPTCDCSYEQRKQGYGCEICCPDNFGNEMDWGHYHGFL